MEIFKIENLTFKYPNSHKPALININLSVKSGEFILICGKSGCGKSTLLKSLKPSLTPNGKKTGKVYFEDAEAETLSLRKQAEKIGYVLQSPDNQIVCDTVWHELAFGLESLGYKTVEIRARVAEMASFFGIEKWFYKKVSELSGGQKQLLNLASVMVMEPSVLILDEPTSQLDPISAAEFLKTVEKINRELGTTVIMSEHRLEEVFAMADKVAVMEGGKIIAYDTPRNVGCSLRNNEIFAGFPTAMRIYYGLKAGGECAVTVRDGRNFIKKTAQERGICSFNANNDGKTSEQVSVELNDVWFRYDKNLPDVLKGVSFKINKGEIYAILGGNGTGKTTFISVIHGLLRPYRGKVKINGTGLADIKEKYNGLFGVLPQNPQTLFVKKTVEDDLLDMLEDEAILEDERHKKIYEMTQLCEIESLLKSHPFDLSGGEQQRVALAKILLKQPRILILDEPTKGLDAFFKIKFAQILRVLADKGVTVIMVSHDIEFCVKHSTKCALMFDGQLVSESSSREFFAGKSFYTTAANRMSRGIIDGAVLDSDIITALGGEADTKVDNKADDFEYKIKEVKVSKEDPKKLTPTRILLGALFAVLFVLTFILYQNKYDQYSTQGIAVQFITLFELWACLMFFIPRKTIDTGTQVFKKRRFSKRTVFSIILSLVLIPLTVFAGFYYLQDRKYYIISLLIIIETFIPFVMAFENRKPMARELVVISVLSAIAVAGRTAFLMLPQFKPIVAIVIISGICFGGESGFLIGAVSAFVSNLFFGQGPWTPWQMFALGICGFLAGIVFKGRKKTKTSLCIFGGFVTLFIYGVIVNTSSLLLWQENPTFKMLVLSCVSGLPFDLIHSVSTMFFLWIFAEPMIDKIRRIKDKYGLTI